MVIVDNNHIDYICLFSPKTNLLYCRLILKKDYKHCAVIIRKKDGTWLFIDPRKSTLIRVSIAAVSEHNLCEVYTELGYKVIYGSLEHFIKSNKKNNVSNCVSVAKRIIGIKNSNVRTPYQLCNFLLGNGASSFN